MDEILLEFLETGFNYKKFRKSREKRGYTIKYVAEQVNIPAATIQRYEDGTIKKVSLEFVKKICEFYGTDYRCYYGWSLLPFLGSISGIVFSMVSGISLESIYNGALLGIISGFTAMLGSDKIYNQLLKHKRNKEINTKKMYELLYNSLSQEEKQQFDMYKKVSKTMLSTDSMPDIVEESENVLFTNYLLHYIRKKMGVNICDIIDPRKLEKLDETELLEKINKVVENKKIEKIEQK